MRFLLRRLPGLYLAVAAMGGVTLLFTPTGVAAQTGCRIECERCVCNLKTEICDCTKCVLVGCRL